MDISALVTEWGAYYQDRGQSEANLKTLTFEQSETLAECTQVPWESDSLERSLVSHARVVQPFKTDWSPIEAGVMVPYTINKHRLKVDIEKTPDTYTLKTWLGFMKTNNLDKTEHPFVMWYILTQLVPQITEDIELNESYAGVYAAPAAGATPGAVGTSFDGFGKVIADAITDGHITPITTGVLSATDSVFVEQVEDMVALIADKFRKKEMTLYMSPANAARYPKGYEDLYGMTPQSSGKPGYVDHSLRHQPNIKIKSLASMSGSDRLWVTEKKNLICLTNDDDKNQGQFQVKELSPRKVSIWTDFELGPGFDDPRVVFCNEQV